MAGDDERRVCKRGAGHVERSKRVAGYYERRVRKREAGHDERRARKRKAGDDERRCTKIGRAFKQALPKCLLRYVCRFVFVGEDAAPMYGYGEATSIFTVMERLLRFLWLWRGYSDFYSYGEAAPIFKVMEKLLR